MFSHESCRVPPPGSLRSIADARIGVLGAKNGGQRPLAGEVELAESAGL
jgi:hypothetical protein